MNDATVFETPASREAEGIILGSIMLDNAHCDEAAQLLSPSDFSLDANRRIYRSMCDLRQQGKLVEESRLRRSWIEGEIWKRLVGAATLMICPMGL